MPETAADLYASFLKAAENANAVRASGDSAHSSRSLIQRDLNHVYEASFLAVVAAFESFQEDLFYCALLGHSGISEARTIAGFGTRAEAEKIVHGRDRGGVVSWSKMNENVARARLFLRRGRPFSRIARHPQDLEVLRIASIVRNAIAHKSGSAREKFLGLQLGGLPSPKRTPAGFLQSSIGGITQHESLIGGLVRIAKALTAPRDGTAWRHLGIEAPYVTGDRADRGTYECSNCGTRVRHTSANAQLPSCPGCGKGPCPTCNKARKDKFQRVLR